jgi:predicted enzyme related to lactoylglutathione lyase
MALPVTGIGGFFFRAKDPKTLGAWYEKYFGINSMQSGYVWNQEAGPTVFAPFKEDTDYFGNRDQQFMLNFRVSDLEQLLDQLKTDGVKVDEKRMEESFGKFAWVYDLEGNKIELWQPIETPTNKE